MTYVATEDISSVATEETPSVAAEEMPFAATEDLSSVAAVDISQERLEALRDNCGSEKVMPIAADLRNPKICSGYTLKF